MLQTRLACFAFAVCLVLYLVSTSQAQIIYNVPPNVAPDSLSGTDVLNLGPGGVVAGGLDLFDQATLNVIGGSLAALPYAYGSSSIFMVDGGANSMLLYDTSELTVSGGTMSIAFATDLSRVEITGGELFRAALSGNSELSFSGGEVEYVQMTGFATGVVSDNAVTDRVGTYLNSDLDITGGTIRQVQAFNQSRIDFQAGTDTETVEADDSATVYVGAGVNTGALIAQGGSTVVVTGGKAATNSQVMNNARLALYDGDLGTRLTVTGTSTLDYSGGSIGDEFFLVEGTMNLEGREFFVDGVPVSGLDTLGQTQPVVVPEGSVLSGTASDGTVFAFSTSDRDVLDGDIVLIVSDPLPPVTPSTIPSDGSWQGARPGEVVTANPGAVIPDNRAAGVGSQITADGATFGTNFEVVGAQVDIANSQVGTDFDAFLDAAVNFVDSNVGTGFQALGTSQVSFSGGTLADGVVSDQATVELSTSLTGHFEARDAATLNVTGGTVPGDIEAHEQAVVTISGDNVSSIKVFDEAGLTVEGGVTQSVVASQDAMINVNAGTITGDIVMEDDSSLTVRGGTIQGTVELFGSNTVEFLGGYTEQFRGRYTSEILVDGGSIGEDSALIVGSHLTLMSGSIGDDFGVSLNSSVTMYGGDIGDLFGTFGEFEIFGGTVGRDMHFGGDSVVTVHGGFIDTGFHLTSIITSTITIDPELNLHGGTLRDLTLRDSSMANMTGGEVEDFLHLRNQSTFNMWGGQLGSSVFMPDSATMNLFGGDFDDFFFANAGSSINLFGSEFLLDGVPILGPDDPGDSLLIAQRGGSVLSGLLEDGTFFELTLSDQFSPTGSYFSQDAFVTVTISVPEPSGLLLMAMGVGVFAAIQVRRHRRI